MSSTSQQSFDRRMFLWQFYRFNARISLDRLIKGVDFSRCFEYLTAYQKLLSKQRGCLLDIGSHQSPFPLFMANQGFRVLATDIETFVTRQRKWALKAKMAEKFSITLTNGRRLSFKNSSFDAISAVSTIEHIPANGDIEALAELGRVINPGGLIFVSVPYEQAYREGSWGPWFQRYYDGSSLLNRLVVPSGLELKECGYLLGKNSRRFYGPLYRLPGRIHRALGWLHLFFALYYLDRDVATEEDANVAWLLLERPTNSTFGSR
jgi:2-polyprenyl-3-methyl-5-hydroxy-6-metoxy-1,4-benzoquinol methylase